MALIGEVAASRRVDEREVRIAGDFEAAMAASGFRLATRQRDIDAGDLVDGEALPDRIDAAELTEQRLDAVGAGDRRPRGRGPWTAGPSAGRAPTRRRPARGRRPRERARAMAAAISTFDRLGRGLTGPRGGARTLRTILSVNAGAIALTIVRAREAACG